MKNTQRIAAFIVALIIGFALSACDKDETEKVTVAESISTTADDEIAADYYAEATADTDEAETASVGKKGTGLNFQSCATLSITFTATGMNLVIDFGTEGCTGPRGHVRKGKIIVSTTGQIRTNGFKKTITFENFYIDDALIEGTRTVTTSLINNVLTQTIVVEDGSITLLGGNIITYQENKTRTLVEGYGTVSIADDVWEVSGSTTGVNYKQVPYTVQITKPIRHTTTCRFPVSGTKTLTVGDKVVSIDFGSGTCDKIATLTINGQTKEIELGKRQSSN